VPGTFIPFVYLLFLSFFVSEIESHYVAQADLTLCYLAETGLKLAILLPQPPESWDSWHVPSSPAILIFQTLCVPFKECSMKR
jgi:hypothetical protein